MESFPEGTERQGDSYFGNSQAKISEKMVGRDGERISKKNNKSHAPEVCLPIRDSLSSGLDRGIRDDFDKPAAVGAPGAGQGVGFEAGCLDIVAGPPAGVVVAGGVQVLRVFKEPMPASMEPL